MARVPKHTLAESVLTQAFAYICLILHISERSESFFPFSLAGYSAG